MIQEKYINKCRIIPGKKVDLRRFNTGWSQDDDLEAAGNKAVKERALETLEKNRRELYAAQELLWANNTYSVLIILQGMDTSGKDGTIKHVMSGVNPQGCRVTSFKAPSEEELDHDFLWRYWRHLPARGEIAVFNRSYYEEVLVVKIHPDLLERQRIPGERPGKKFWKARYEDINAYEHHLTQNGTLILKFYLHISKDEQKERLLDRLKNDEKLWKYAISDQKERQYWDDYIKAYEDMLYATSTNWAPWYVIPGDHKWVARTLVAEIISTTIRSLDLRYPKVTEEQRAALIEARKELEQE
jgi:PPK2 family polyphosphate:nucleotide phosphotransferase